MQNNKLYLVVLMCLIPSIAYSAAGEGISTWPEIPVVADGDLVAGTDVSNTTGSDNGTSVKIPASKLATYMQGFFYTESEADSLLSGKEDSLGNPDTDGYVLSSTTLGVRSWVELASGGATQLDALTDVTGDGTVDYMLYDDGDGTYSFRAAPTGVGLSQAEIEALANLDLSGVNVTLHSDNALDTDITYETLNTNGDVGTSAGQLAIGNHTHSGVYEPADATIVKDADLQSIIHTDCIYIEDPDANDDLQSIWRPTTAITLTGIWAESDQTVNFDLQVDDGTPADVNGTDISPAAGTAEDVTLSGDTTMAAGDRLDLAVTSVANTPTWVSICWSYTKD